MKLIRRSSLTATELVLLALALVTATGSYYQPPSTTLHLAPGHHARRFDPPDEAPDEPNTARVPQRRGRDESPEIRAGMENVQRLLPLARELTLRALNAQAARFAISADALRHATDDISAVRAISLDRHLGDMAEFDDERPHEIRVGPGYAQYLGSDEEAMMMLGHELTHSAAQDENLAPFFSSVEDAVSRATPIRPSDVQNVELVCDYIGEQVVRLYIDTHPSRESTVARLARALEMDDDEVAGADTADTADTADAADDGDAGDDGDGDEHLGHYDTMTALRVLDPDLSRLLAAR